MDENGGKLICVQKRKWVWEVFFYYYHFFFFKKKDIRKCIWMSDVDGNKNQLDFLLVQKKDRERLLDINFRLIG